jgi:hypothetical protein
MLEAFTGEEMRLQIKSWFARVPSLSNLADSPSRLEDKLLLDLGMGERANRLAGNGQGSWAGSRNGG